MDILPNGFTGFAGTGGRPDDFESAAEASRRSRGIAPEPRQVPSSGGAHRRFSETLHAESADHDVIARAAHAGDVHANGGLHAGNPAHADGAAPDTAQLDSIPDTDQRWAWVEVDLSAIHRNVTAVRRILQPRSRLLAVVKADGYGHGAFEVAKTALRAGAERLGVATVPEAVELRKAGITAPILLLSQPPATSIPLLVGYGITPSVYEAQFAVAYGEAADMQGAKAPYHLAVNTGLNRLGVRHDEAVEFLYQVDFHRALELEGVFTHYATADCPETLDFQIQTRRFAESVNAMRASGFNPGIVHAANSAATCRFPEVHFDMVRVGISLYGFHPCPETRGRVNLQPAMSVHARIVDIRTPAVSEGVSYGLHYRSPGSVKICTIPLGYADGLRLGLSGNTDFVMGGRYYRQVGNICMDQSMFEVDMRTYGTRERIDPQVGDEVLVVGGQGIAEVTIDEMAEKLRTTQYEIALGFGQRLKRVYR